MRGAGAVKGIVLQIVGWVLVLAGIAALVLPGPGLLALFAGMAVLATQYDWAERRVEPIKEAALKGAADSVASPARIALSVLGVVGLIAVGVVWGLRPDAPSFWPLADRWWLFGGWSVGGSLIASGFLAAGTLVYSWLKFRKPGDRPGVRDTA